jgi:hypothetical protein
MFACCHILQRANPGYVLAGSVIALSLTIWSSDALAYRPFDGTDAAVAAPGEMEIELQPAGPRRDEGGTSLLAPVTVINYGFSENWEAVFEGTGQTPLSPGGPANLTDGGRSLSMCCGPEACRTSLVPALQQNLACCSRTAPAIQVSGQAWRASSRSALTGERSTSTRKPRLRANIMAMSLPASSSKDRTRGRFGRWRKFSTRTSSASRRRSPVSSG